MVYENLDSVPGQVIPKTQKKMVLNAFLLSTRYYKVWVKSKVDQSKERNSALPYTSLVAIEKGAFDLPSTRVGQLTYRAQNKFQPLLGDTQTHTHRHFGRVSAFNICLLIFFLFFFFSPVKWIGVGKARASMIQVFWYNLNL